ncbi:MAG: aminopeptidase [Gammaproteobacteria bacterium]|nr:aminopeptidase [Gammaproteobacteria bacterium]
MSHLSSSQTLAKLSLVILVLLGLGACEPLSYYQQAVRGQMSILWNRQQIEDLLQRDDIPELLKEKLNTVVTIREFAEEQLLLPSGGSYHSYVDLGREHVVWNVFAAPEFSVEPVAWCYPVAGCVSYRGYFAQDKAVNFAHALEQDGYDVYTGGVDAYSTLGWFNDPLLSSVINRADYQLAALVFHELAHRRVYLPGDTTFNESFATMVEREGLRRWLNTRGDSQSIALAGQQAGRQQQFIDLVISFRDQFEQLYESELSEQNKRSRKSALQQEMRLAYEEMKKDWGGVSSYDRWFSASLNNAQLSTVSSYNERVPEFEKMLVRLGGDLGAFYQEVAALAEKSETH